MAEPLGVVAVIGSGTMGQGIAQHCAQMGYEVRLVDNLPTRAEAAKNGIALMLERLELKGKLGAADREATLGRIHVENTVAAATRDAAVAIEAVPESIDLKVAIFREAHATAPPDCMLATNTSSLSVTEIGSRVGRPERVVGLHFFNPVPLMDLVEVVRGIDTSDATVARAVSFSQSLKKTAIVVRDVPGFATSRLGVMLGCEAMRMVEQGVASAADIDRGMELGYRHPMGPLKLTDLVGLDVRLAILEHLHREIGEQFRPPSLLRTLVRAGKLGKKTGEGFYLWQDGQPIAKSR
jgi:3-hydroxybutyryl-CoA dehydrogenase